MATFQQIYEKCNGGNFKAIDHDGNVIAYTGGVPQWFGSGSPVSYCFLAKDIWSLIPPEPTVEQILAEGEFRLSDTPGYDGIVQIRPADKFKGPIWPCLYVEAVKLTTAEAARELVRFLEKYR